MLLWMYNWRDYLTSRHKVTPERWHAVKINLSIYLFLLTQEHFFNAVIRTWHRYLFFEMGCLAFVPDGVSKSMIYSRPNGPQFRSSHRRIINKQIIVLYVRVWFKLWAGIRAGLTLHLMSLFPPGSTCSYCTQWANDKQSLAGLKSRFVLDLTLP